MRKNNLLNTFEWCIVAQWWIIYGIKRNIEEDNVWWNTTKGFWWINYSIGDLDKIIPYTYTQIIIGGLNIGKFYPEIANCQNLLLTNTSLLYTTLWLPLHLNLNMTALYFRMISTCSKCAWVVGVISIHLAYGTKFWQSLNIVCSLLVTPFITGHTLLHLQHCPESASPDE